MAARHREADAAAFVQRHSSVLEKLAIISPILRAIRFLSPTELDQLEASCKKVAANFRDAYPDHRIVTVKMHIVERHLWRIARRYGTLGIFGEDGIEALHPLDSRARILTRSMRNPKARHSSTTLHSTLQQIYHSEKKVKRA